MFAGFPFYVGLTNAVYLGIALLLTCLFVAMAMQFHGKRNSSSARNLFLTSIIYLPLLLGALVMTKR
jgi:protoheme IX farnesyltransferase